MPGKLSGCLPSESGDGPEDLHIDPEQLQVAAEPVRDDSRRGPGVDGADRTVEIQEQEPGAGQDLLAGVPVHVVAARLGHADPSVTLRVYAHVIHSAEAEATDVFARVIRAQKRSAVSKSVSKKPRRRAGRGL